MKLTHFLVAGCAMPTCDGIHDNSATQMLQTGKFTIPPLVRLCFALIYLFRPFALYLFAKSGTRSCIKTPDFSLAVSLTRAQDIGMGAGQQIPLSTNQPSPQVLSVTEETTAEACDLEKQAVQEGTNALSRNQIHLQTTAAEGVETQPGTKIIPRRTVSKELDLFLAKEV